MPEEPSGHLSRWWELLSDSDKHSARQQAQTGRAVLPRRRLDYAYQLLEKDLRKVIQGNAGTKQPVTDAAHDHTQ